MSGNKSGPATAFAGGMIALALLAGCASAPGPSQRAEAPQGETAESAAHHHGQSPAAPEAVASGQPAATLRPDPFDSPAPASVLEAERAAEIVSGDHGGHGSHGAGTYRQVDAGREGSGKSEPHRHEPTPSPHSGHEHGHSHEPPAAAADTVYACPMHPEVTSNAPGKCSKCGMDLAERRKP